MAVKRITIGEVEYVAHALAKELMNWDEPIPAFSTRFPNAPESCLATPFQRFERKQPYPSLIDKASILFYLMVKNHPFRNGNKRIAVTTLLFFLLKNGKWMTVDNIQLYNFAKWVATSDPKLKDPTVGAVQAFLKLYVTDPPTEILAKISQ